MAAWKKGAIGGVIWGLIAGIAHILSLSMQNDSNFVLALLYVITLPLKLTAYLEIFGLLGFHSVFLYSVIIGMVLGALLGHIYGSIKRKN